MSGIYVKKVMIATSAESFKGLSKNNNTCRGGEWHLEKPGSWKILAASWNVGSIFDKSQSLVFAWFVFTFFESWNFLPKNHISGSDYFQTRILASRRVSDFTIHHPHLQPSHSWVVSHTNPCQLHSQGSLLTIPFGGITQGQGNYIYSGLITMFVVVTQLKLYWGTTHKLFHCVDIYYLSDN